jgi:hypothetical protein
VKLYVVDASVAGKWLLPGPSKPLQQEALLDSALDKSLWTERVRQHLRCPSAGDQEETWSLRTKTRQRCGHRSARCLARRNIELGLGTREDVDEPLKFRPSARRGRSRRRSNSSSARSRKSLRPATAPSAAASTGREKTNSATQCQ